MLCFIGSLGFIFLIKETYSYKSSDTICVELPFISTKVNLNNVLKILKEDEQYSWVSVPCTDLVVDDFGNVFNFSGSWRKMCENQTILPHLKEIKVWRSNECGYFFRFNFPKVPTEFSVKNSVNYKEKSNCGMFNRWFTSAFNCDYNEDIRWQECSWINDNSVQLFVNNVLINDSILDSFSTIDTPFGFWLNQAGFIKKSSISDNFHQSEYNYSCVPSSVPSNNDYYKFNSIHPINFIEAEPSCNNVFKISNQHLQRNNFEFCSSVHLFKDPSTDSTGVRSLSGDCIIRVLDDSASIYYLLLRSNQTRVFKNLVNISCILDDGLTVRIPLHLR
jgi:hypothetical protein